MLYQLNQRVGEKPDKAEKPFLKITLTIVAFLVPMVLFLILANGVRGDQPLPGDVAILQAIHAGSAPLLDTALVALTHLGSAEIVVPAVLIAAAILFFKFKHRTQALFLLLCAGGTSAINVIFKHIFQRNRPELWDHLVTETSFSFPSGHAMISSTIALTVIILCWHTRFRIPALIASILYCLIVSFSRLYLGVHFPSDIIGGWCVSALWVGVVYAVFRRFNLLPQNPASK